MFPSLSIEGATFRNWNRSVLIRSLNPDLIVLVRQELFQVYFLFSDLSLEILCTIKHHLLLYITTFYKDCLVDVISQNPSPPGERLIP